MKLTVPHSPTPTLSVAPSNFPSPPASMFPSVTPTIGLMLSQRTQPSLQPSSSLTFVATEEEVNGGTGNIFQRGHRATQTSDVATDDKEQADGPITELCRTTTSSAPESPWMPFLLFCCGILIGIVLAVTPAGIRRGSFRDWRQVLNRNDATTNDPTFAKCLPTWYTSSNAAYTKVSDSWTQAVPLYFENGMLSLNLHIVLSPWHATTKKEVSSEQAVARRIKKQTQVHGYYSYKMDLQAPLTVCR